MFGATACNSTIYWNDKIVVIVDVILTKTSQQEERDIYVCDKKKFKISYEIYYFHVQIRQEFKYNWNLKMEVY